MPLISLNWAWHSLDFACSDCCHYATAGGKNYTLLKHDNPDCSCTYRLDNDYNTTNPQQFCLSGYNSACMDGRKENYCYLINILLFFVDYLAQNLCKEIGAGDWRVYNWWQAISPCFSKEWGVGDIDSSLCMKSPSQDYQNRVDEAVDDFNMVGRFILFSCLYELYFRQYQMIQH